MWTVVTRPSQALRLKRLVPERVLDEYDGPRLFTVRSDQNDLLLAYLCAQDADVERFLVVPTNDMIINDLEKSEIAIRDALVGRGWSWLVDRMKDGSISILGALDRGVLPEDALPTRGARLSPNAQPHLRLKMIGEALAPKRVPASVIERAVKGVTSAVRILTRYAQRRMPTTGRPAESFRRYYDLPAIGFAFGSFEIEFDRPTPDPLRLNWIWRSHKRLQRLRLSLFEDCNGRAIRKPRNSRKPASRPRLWKHSRTLRHLKRGL